MAHGPASLNREYRLTRGSVASGFFEYRYQSQAIPIVFGEGLLIALAVYLTQHSLGLAIFTFLGILTAFAIPYLRQILALALSGAYVGMAIAFAREVTAGSHHVLTGLDRAGIGFLVFLIAYSLHADFASGVRDPD